MQNLSHDLARIVGLWLAEGDRSTTLEVTFTNNQPNLVKLFNDTLQAHFLLRNVPRVAVYLPFPGARFAKPVARARYRVYVDHRSTIPYYLYRVSGVGLVRLWRQSVTAVCSDTRNYRWILQGFFAGEGNIKYSKPSRSRVVRIAQRSRHPLVEKILDFFGVTFRYHSHGEYWIWSRKNLEKLREIDVSILHPLKHKKFVKMMEDYRQWHYTRGSLREMILQNLASPSTSRALAIHLERSPARISQVLSALHLEGRARMFRVHSTFYWVRSDMAVTVISPEKWKIIEKIRMPARLSEIAKGVSRDEHAVKRRLEELERLGLVICKSSKWSAIPTSNRVIVPSH